jgi:hypothetical protein
MLPKLFRYGINMLENQEIVEEFEDEEEIEEEEE